MKFYICIICILCLGVWCNGDDENVSAPMKKTEQEALYSTIQDFVVKSWNGSDLYPDPCGWTPIQRIGSLAGSLEVLEFRSNPGLVTKIPATFGYLRNLHSLENDSLSRPFVQSLTRLSLK
ncbi:piriformospora indica-insensitive 2-like [Olea europaea subsp. europaea]|uniref:Piriformospora indica-insensitive 2-like n=1 Tax=Olea europaea subsp. europaea TaxID=158383 RepID=A0A8S0SRB8_OLEEU|nr:piriformospora indica-insensitive 2-like [Olea europaea subsp. europaea]